MFHTFSSSNKQYIIEAAIKLDSFSTMEKINKGENEPCKYLLSSFEPSVDFSEISAFISTTILYENGKVEVFSSNSKETSICE